MHVEPTFEWSPEEPTRAEPDPDPDTMGSSHPHRGQRVEQVEGTIVEIEDRWPPRLVVRCGGERRAVALHEESKVMRKGHAVAAVHLRERQRIRAIGRSCGPVRGAMVAMHVEILE